MSSTEAPEPWAAAMIEKGCTHNGRPSISALARKMGTSVETARRLVNGVGDPSPATIKEAVRVLGTQVQDWTGTAPVGDPYQAPASSAWLTERQRQALDELINAFVERGSGVNGQASTTETSRAEGSSAPKESEVEKAILRRLRNDIVHGIEADEPELHFRVDLGRGEVEAGVPEGSLEDALSQWALVLGETVVHQQEDFTPATRKGDKRGWRLRRAQDEAESGSQLPADERADGLQAGGE